MITRGKSKLVGEPSYAILIPYKERYLLVELNSLRPDPRLFLRPNVSYRTQTDIEVVNRRYKKLRIKIDNRIFSMCSKDNCFASS